MNVHGIHLTRLNDRAWLAEPSRAFDLSQSALVMEALLDELSRHRAHRLFYDLAELPVIDEAYYAWLDALARACQAMNVRMTCVHMQPAAAFALAGFVDRPPAFETALEMENY